MKKVLVILSAVMSPCCLAAESTPNLPPADAVARVLLANPMVQAAGSQIRQAEANRSRLEAGQYEWNVRLAGQQRQVAPAGAPESRYTEWNAALERAWRLPGKGALDAELGAVGVAVAETAHGDALHETSRNLLHAWFVWLKANASLTQWDEQVALLHKQATALQRRLQLGDAARLESIQSDAALSQAQAQQAQARVRQQTAAEELQRRFPGLPLLVPESIAEPTALRGSEADWLAAVLKHNHELALTRGETQKARIAARRSERDRLADPTVGLQVMRERAGEERILGAYISIPLSGGARRATADAALAQAEATAYREAASEQKLAAEAATLYHEARAALATWQAGRTAAEHMGRAAEMTARAYQLGEGSLNESLSARRLANEAQLAARLMQLDALELHYRLLLDAHQLWDFDEEKHAAE